MTWPDVPTLGMVLGPLELCWGQDCFCMQAGPGNLRLQHLALNTGIIPKDRVDMCPCLFSTKPRSWERTAGPASIPGTQEHTSALAAHLSLSIAERGVPQSSQLTPSFS